MASESKKTKVLTAAKVAIKAPVKIEKKVELKGPVVASKAVAAKPEIPKSEPNGIDFKVNDKIVYPPHGVGIVEAIESRSVSGTEQKFYKIILIESGMKGMVAISQAQRVGLRRVVDEGTVDKVYDILRDRKIQVDTQTWNRRYREYSQKIKTGSVIEIAHVIRDLSVLKIDKELSFGEKRMLDAAQGLLIKEISIAKARSEDTVKDELQKICQVSF
jgi:CarD family transcriptional regulator